MQKRKEYRKRHGGEERKGWVLRGEREGRGEGPAGGRVLGEEGGVGGGEGTEGYTDFEGRTRRPVKKWLGIW